MPDSLSRTSMASLLLLAGAVLLIILFLLATPLSAFADAGDIVATATEGAGSDGVSWDDVVTQERVMLLITFGLVVLTWFYLKWRGVPTGDDERESEPEEHQR